MSERAAQLIQDDLQFMGSRCALAHVESAAEDRRRGRKLDGERRQSSSRRGGEGAMVV
jgi:hypothetical protein